MHCRVLGFSFSPVDIPSEEVDNTFGYKSLRKIRRNSTQIIKPNLLRQNERNKESVIIFPIFQKLSDSHHCFRFLSNETNCLEISKYKHPCFQGFSRCAASRLSVPLLNTHRKQKFGEMGFWNNCFVFEGNAAVTVRRGNK